MHIASKTLGSAAVAALMATATALAGNLPADKYKEWSVEKEVFVPMRDGVRLSTDVALPKGATGKLPTILVRTPYDRDRLETLQSYEIYLKQGFAVVLQNERGRFFSEGSFNNYLAGASKDGYDAIDWVTKQPWSNGKVGTIGCSSSAEQQWPMAAANHPGHAAMIPNASGTAIGNIPGNDTRGAFYRGGVPWIGMWAWWYHMLATGERLLLPADSTQEQRIRLRNTYSLLPTVFFHDKSGWSKIDVSNFMHLPSKDLMRHLGGVQNPYENYITWTPADPRWNAVEHIGAGAKPRVPALHTNTWYDIAVGETTRFFKYVQDQGTPNQYLIIGAGPHCQFSGNLTALKFDDVDVGDASYGGFDEGYQKLFLSWFEHWVRGDGNNVTDMPKVQLHVMNKGWVTGERWPLPKTQFTKYYLDGDAGAQDSPAKGSLAASAPRTSVKDSYFYDPTVPAPSLGGGGCCGLPSALDQRPAQARRDVLVYGTAPLAKPVTIAGPVEVVLYVSSSAKDTDFIVKLVDVYPDGKSIPLGDDAFRMRYRNGFDKKVAMQAGEVYKITLTNMVSAIQFPKGHRIRLDVSSSSMPMYERNLNTGGNNFDETVGVIAENSVLHGAQNPSHVVLPVLPD